MCECGLTQETEEEWFSMDGCVMGSKMADRPQLILRDLRDLLRLSFHQPSSLTGSVTLCGHTKKHDICDSRSRQKSSDTSLKSLFLRFSDSMSNSSPDREAEEKHGVRGGNGWEQTVHKVELKRGRGHLQGQLHPCSHLGDPQLPKKHKG